MLVLVLWFEISLELVQQLNRRVKKIALLLLAVALIFSASRAGCNSR